MDFKGRLRAARKAKGLSQEQLAAALGLTRAAVQGWEAGRCEPEFRKIVPLSRLLGVSIDYLLAGEDGKGEVPPPDVAAVLDGLACSVDKGEAVLDGAALRPEAAATASPMLRGTLAATRAAQKGGRRRGR